MGDDMIKGLEAIGKQIGYNSMLSGTKESENIREKNAKKTSEHILQDGGSAKAPEDSMGLSDDAKEERGLKARNVNEMKETKEN